VLDYLEGSRKCKTNSERLETSARIILDDNDGTDSFGLFLYHIAYEEIAKAVYCLLIHSGKIKNEEFIKPIFRDHEAKIILLDKIFNSNSFSILDGVACFDDLPIDSIRLRDLTKEYSKKLEKHRTETMDLLYVDREEKKWKNPNLIIKDIKKLENDMRSKILSLHTVYEIIDKSNLKGTLDNFKIIKSDEGRITVQWNTK